MQKILICLMGIISIFHAHAGVITTKSNDRLIEAKCFNYDGSNQCTNWHIISKENGRYDIVIGQLSTLNPDQDIDLNLRNRSVRKFQYLPLTKAIWLCGDEIGCEVGSGLAAVSLSTVGLGAFIFWIASAGDAPNEAEAGAIMVLIGLGVAAIPTALDIVSLPVRAALQGIKIRRAKNLEAESIKYLMSLLDENAEDIIVSKRKFRLVRSALFGLPKVENK